MALVFALWPTLGSAGPLDPLACPADTHVRSTSAARSREEWCERSSGTRHGPYRSFLGAERASAGQYVDGEKDGPWMQWYPDGALSQEEVWNRGVAEMRGSYRHGQQHGTWTWRYASGRKKAVSTYGDGRKQGRETGWDDSGEVTYDGRYDRDKRVGRWIESWDGGHRARGTYCADQRCGHWEIFNDWGLVASGEYQAGVRDGVWTLWNGKRPRSRATYAHGQKHGRYERWDGDSERKILETRCSHGIAHGLRREWGEDGKLRLAEHYDQGQLHGVAWSTDLAVINGVPSETATRGVYDHGLLVSGDPIGDSGVMHPDGEAGNEECSEGTLGDWTIPEA
jgi:antitoxin component YwqK of YwqJK toxin-antitoxin module